MITAMKTANIAEFKDGLAKFIAAVEGGEEIEIRRRNLPVARLVPIRRNAGNETVLGCGRGTARVLADLTEPLIAKGDWEMLDGGSE